MIDFTIPYNFSSEVSTARGSAVSVFVTWYLEACTSRNIVPENYNLVPADENILTGIEAYFDGTSNIEDFVKLCRFSSLQYKMFMKSYKDIIALDKIAQFLTVATETNIPTCSLSVYNWIQEVNATPQPSADDLEVIRANY